MKGTLRNCRRARMEWHPELARGSGPVPGVVLGLLGQQRAEQLNLKWSTSADTGKGRYFKDTGQSVQGGFLDFWLNNGGERIFGMPISPEMPMRHPADGKTYTTQYFQRARMEYHPELPEGQRVVLGALGSEQAPIRRSRWPTNVQMQATGRTPQSLSICSRFQARRLKRTLTAESWLAGRNEVVLQEGLNAWRR